MKFIYFSLLIILSQNQNSFAQNSSIELWPEVDIWYRLNSSWRFSSFIPITKYNESKNRDLNINLSADYAWGKTKLVLFRKFVNDEEKLRLNAYMARLGVMKGWSLGDESESYKEKMVFTEIHKRIPLKKNILISHRFRIDNRWLGQEADYSYRLRYRFMIEKEFKKEKTSIVPYFNVEPYWDSRYSKIIRARVIGGASFSVSPKLAFESNLTYQYDQTYTTENLYALNVICHFYLGNKK